MTASQLTTCALPAIHFEAAGVCIQEFQGEDSSKATA